MALTVTCQAYGKINIYLDVLKKRRDGYHNLETLFQSVSLADVLEFRSEGKEITFEMEGPASVPADDRNLAVRAAILLRDRFQTGRGAHIRLIKRIPAAAGMAGGSADAAAVLVVLNKLWELRLTQTELAKLALELGADVPFCLVGGAKAARLRGEDLYTVHPPVAVWYVLVHPDLELSTKAIFTSPLLTCNTDPPFAGWTMSFRKVREAFEKGDFSLAVYNRLEDVAFAMHSELSGIKSKLLSAGCLAAGMSGSGPTIFGVCRSKEEAQFVARSFADRRVSIVCPTRVGVNIPDEPANEI